MIELLAQAVSEIAAPWNLIAQGSIATGTVATLVYAVGKIATAQQAMTTKHTESLAAQAKAGDEARASQTKQMSEAQATLMRETMSSMREMVGEIRKYESLRTDAAVSAIAAQIGVLNEITKSQAAGLGILQASNRDVRETLHSVRGTAEELVSAKFLVEKGDRLQSKDAV